MLTEKAVYNPFSRVPNVRTIKMIFNRLHQILDKKVCAGWDDIAPDGSNIRVLKAAADEKISQ
ncbi:hypothetical protein ACGVWS_11730 [Enterobacteriaceae bacterium LUAb1]